VVRGFYRDLRAGPTEIYILVTMSSSSRRGQRCDGSVLAEAEIARGVVRVYAILAVTRTPYVSRHV